MSGPAKPTAAQKTATAMRAEIFALGSDGKFLGSEDDLLVRYAVSRPTLRQAARILEHEQLITVRRGVNGGIFTRLPSIEAVSRVAAVYLQANGTTVQDLQRAVGTMSPSVARAAASNPSDAARAELLAWVDAEEAAGRPARSREVLAFAAEFGSRLATLADCPPLSLFQSVLVELAFAETSVNLFNSADRVAIMRRSCRELAVAVRDGHVAKAERLARENVERTSAWLPQRGRSMGNRRAPTGRTQSS